MATIQQLMDRRANAWEQMKTLLGVGEPGDKIMSGEERSSYEALERDLAGFDSQIELQKRHEQQAALMETVDRSELAGGGKSAEELTDQERYSRSFTKFLRYGMDELEPEERRAVRTGVMDAKELRALGGTTTTAGGYTVPATFRNRLVEQLKTFGGMYGAAEVITTETGANLSWPTHDGTANKGAILAENTQVTELDETFGTASIDAFKYTSKMTRVSLELLQDSEIDVEAWLATRLAERLGRATNEHFTTGTGSSQPDGLVTGAPTGKVGAAGQLTSITYDDLIDMVDSLDPAYQGNAGWMLGAQTRKAIRKLKDTTGQPLWQPSIQAGVPDLLLGYGYRINQDMPSPGANAKSLLFGDFKQAYLIRQVRDLQLVVFNERYMDYFQRGFVSFLRTDGTLQNSSAVRAYVHPAT